MTKMIPTPGTAQPPMWDVTAVKEPDSAALHAECTSLAAQATAFVVHDDASMAIAGEMLRDAATYRSRIVEFFALSKALAHKTHKAICAQEAKAIGTAEAAAAMLKSKRGLYSREQDRLRRVEEDRLRAIARKEEEDRRLAQAEALEREGDKEAAEAVIEAPIRPPPVVLPSTTPKTEGVSVRVNWKHRIVDEHLIPRQWMTPNEKAIGYHARMMKSMAAIPGVEFYPERDETVRAREE